ncbi:MAG: replicative DNA helicase [Clostridia bacterium]|nr:replicative DNA helicase [Clostridia bacterium]
MDEQIGRTLPYSLEAEQAVLGCMIKSSIAMTHVMEMQIHEDDFYFGQHKIIYDALGRLFIENRPVDLIVLSETLKEQLAAIGGVSYLASIVDSVDTTENVKYYIDIIKSKAVLRRLIESSNEIADMCYEGAEDVSAILEFAEQKIFSIIQGRGQKGFYHIRDIIPDVIKKIEDVRSAGGNVAGVPTGFRELDAVTTGLQKTDLIILAARPGVGKSSFALNIASHVAKKSQLPVAIFTLEMSKEQLANRLLWSEAKIEGEKFRNGSINGEDMKKIAHALGGLVKSPIYIDDTTSIPVSEMMAKCRKLKLEKGLGLVVIDYLQLMQGGKSKESRQQEISEISRSLKIMAKELDVPVLTLSQLSRASETRERPILSDLRESGAIEQDADIVIFLNRKTGDDASPEDANLAECNIAKHRNGSTARFDLVWRGEYTTFMDCDTVH